MTMRIASRRIEKEYLSVPGEPAAEQFQGGVAGASAEAEFARERLAGAIDRETDGGKAADRSSGQYRRLLLHRSAIAPSAPANSAGDLLLLLDHVLDGNSSIVRVVIIIVMSLDCRRWLSIWGYRRRLLTASSCFYHERRGDDADAR